MICFCLGVQADVTDKQLKVNDIIAAAREALKAERNISLVTRKAVDELIGVTTALANQVGLNSRNSSIPPSRDPNREKKKRRVKGKKRRKAGGQKGHKPAWLKPVAKPDEEIELEIDRDSLPRGRYKRVGFEKRQVHDFEVLVKVTEYQAEILENSKGEQFVAEFPPGVTEPAQYGSNVKAHSVYMSQFQLVPLKRVQNHFAEQIGISLSKGSVANFNALAGKNLAWYDGWAIKQLVRSSVLNGDETGVNVGGKGHWLHCVSNETITLFHVDARRGVEAMENMGVLPRFRGILVHDHWKPYFDFDCDHSLCNAHHLRELERAADQDGQKWARRMLKFLEELNIAVHEAGGALDKKSAKKSRKQYRKILKEAQRECPRNASERAQSKSRNLLVRLKDFETEALRFMEDKNVPFTNNRAENDQRMTKVQQKISGCFRSLAGAKNFARVRGYLLTCQKNGMDATTALTLIFDGKRPPFMGSG